MLVVDHDPDLLAAITELLRDECVTVEAATEPVGAAQVLHRGFVPDVILLDVISPADEYAEFLELLRDDPATTHVPVVLMSTNRLVLELLRPHASGAVEKPFDTETFFDVVTENCRRG